MNVRSGATNCLLISEEKIAITYINIIFKLNVWITTKLFPMFIDLNRTLIIINIVYLDFLT